MNPSDNLTIDTPEQIALEFSVAGIGSRLLAIAIDTLIQGATYFLIGVGVTVLISWLARHAGRLSGRFASDTAAVWIMAIVFFVLFCLYWGYFAAFEAFWKGRTPGKYFLKIRVIKDNGRPINVYEAIGRNVMRAIDSLPTLYGVGLITMAISKKNQRLGDMLAGTIVVHERGRLAAQPAWVAEAEQPGAAPVPVMVPQLSRLDVRDLQLIEAFLQRREHLQGFTRLHAADQIVQHIANKSEMAPAPNEGPETFLERVAGALRNQVSLRPSESR